MQSTVDGAHRAILREPGRPGSGFVRQARRTWPAAKGITRRQHRWACAMAR